MKFRLYLNHSNRRWCLNIINNECLPINHFVNAGFYGSLYLFCGNRKKKLVTEQRSQVFHNLKWLQQDILIFCISVIFVSWACFALSLWLFLDVLDKCILTHPGKATTTKQNMSKIQNEQDRNVKTKWTEHHRLQTPQYKTE